MRCASIVVAAAAVGIALTACSDSRDSSPTSPDLKPSPSGFTCDNFSTAISLARSYFAQPTQNSVVAILNDAAASTVAAYRTQKGLDVFDTVATQNALRIAGSANTIVGTTQEGSDLLNAIGACSQLGQNAKIDYTSALGPTGAFAVRGGSSTPVRSYDDFSGVAPPSGTTWSAWLGLPSVGNDPPSKDLPDARAAVYGAPFDVTSDLSAETEVGTRGFDWNTLPVAPNFPLNGDGFLAICVGSLDPGNRIQNNHVQGTTPTPGVLGTSNSSPFSLDCSGFTDDGQILASGLLHRIIDVFAPRPLYAAALATRTIGTPGGFSKNFVVNPTAISLTFGPLSDGFVGVPMPPLQVTAKTGSGVPMQRIGLTIDVKTNLGVPANLDGTLTQLTNEFGVATFDNLVLSSAGGYLWHVRTTSGTDGIADAEATSGAFHIKNKRN